MNGSVMLAPLVGSERHNWYCPGLVRTLLHCAEFTCREVVIDPTEDARPMDLAYNVTFRRFLNSHHSWVCLLDNDAAPPQHFLTVLDQPDAEGKLYIGLPVPVFAGGFLWNIGYIAQDGPKYLKPTQLPGPPGFHKVDTIGGACMFVHRQVLETIPHDPYWFEIDANRLLSSDDVFCEKAKKAGFTIWIHTQFPCGHYKSLNLMDARFELNGLMTANFRLAQQLRETQAQLDQIKVAR